MKYRSHTLQFFVRFRLVLWYLTTTMSTSTVEQAQRREKNHIKITTTKFIFILYYSYMRDEGKNVLAVWARSSLLPHWASLCQYEHKSFSFFFGCIMFLKILYGIGKQSYKKGQNYGRTYITYVLRQSNDVMSNQEKKLSNFRADSADINLPSTSFNRSWLQPPNLLNVKKEGK